MKATAATCRAPHTKNQLGFVALDAPTGERFAVVGSLWLPWERRGDFTSEVKALRARFGYHGPIGWLRIREDNYPFMLALVDGVFRHRWLAYRSMVMPTAFGLGAGELGAFLGRDLMRFGSALDQMRVRIRALGARAEVLELRQVTELRAALGRALGEGPLAGVSLIRARTTLAFEVIDVFAHATLADLENRALTAPRRAIADRIAHNLGWRDLAAPTRVSEWKFNQWFSEDPALEAKRFTVHRSVQLRLALDE